MLGSPHGEGRKRSDFLELIGAPEEIRTPDPQIRSLVLYPAELRARNRPLDGPNRTAMQATR